MLARCVLNDKCMEGGKQRGNNGFIFCFKAEPTQSYSDSWETALPKLPEPSTSGAGVDDVSPVSLIDITAKSRHANVSTSIAGGLS